MTPVIKAYMIEATVEIAKEKHFIPTDENDMGCWMMNNREAIVNKAIEIQWGLLNRLEKTKRLKMHWLRSYPLRYGLRLIKIKSIVLSKM